MAATRVAAITERSVTSASTPSPRPSCATRLFRQRATRYREMDERLACRTRFFGAAAIVNAALAEIHARQWARLCAGEAAWRLLIELGGRLEDINLQWAERLLRQQTWPRAGDDTHLDRVMVMLEQREVERLLERRRRADAGAHQSLLLRIDRVLHWGMQSARSGSCAAFPGAPGALRQAVQQVGARLGRAVSFASCADRERIGWSLIQQLRQDGASPR